MIKRLLLMLATGLILVGCESDTFDAPRKFFEKNKIGESADFGIIKHGRDHVVTVHGFYDDLGICQKLAATLNREEPNAYMCQPLNH